MHEAAERFDLFGPIGFAHGELFAREDPFLVQECSVWAHLADLMERARASEEEFGFGAIGKDEEHDAFQPEVLQEERLAQLLDDRSSPGHDLLVRLIRRDEAEIEIRELVGLCSSVGAPEEGGDDPFVARTQRHESLYDGVVITDSLLDRVHAGSLAGRCPSPRVSGGCIHPGQRPRARAPPGVHQRAG